MVKKRKKRERGRKSVVDKKRWGTLEEKERERNQEKRKKEREAEEGGSEQVKKNVTN